MNAFRSSRAMVLMGMIGACAAQPPTQPLDSELGWKVNEKMCDKWLDCHPVLWPNELECIWDDSVMAPECLAACTIDTELAKVCLRELSGYACPEDGFPVITTCKAAITCPDDLPGCVVDWQ